MEQRQPRKRIVYRPKGVPALIDELAFVRNKCSDRARKMLDLLEQIRSISGSTNIISTAISTAIRMAKETASIQKLLRHS